MDRVESQHLKYHESDDDHEVHDFEKDYRHDHPIAWWVALLGPVVATVLILVLIYFVKGWETAASYPAAAASAFFAFGRFIILLGGNEPNPEGGLWFLKYLDARSLFLMLTYMDFIVAMFVAFHMGIVFRLPWVGPKIRQIVSDGEFILRKQPWIRRTAFVGLICFVIFPTSTTGSVGGSIFGRLLGMKRWRVVTAILIGSVLGNGLMLLFSEQISKYVKQDSWALRIIGVLAMIVVLYLFERKFRRLKNDYLAQEQTNQQLSKAVGTEPSSNGQERPSLPKKSANS